MPSVRVHFSVGIRFRIGTEGFSGPQDRLAGENFPAAVLGTLHRRTPNTVLGVISLVRLS
jgi:hypothetical protein